MEYNLQYHEIFLLKKLLEKKGGPLNLEDIKEIDQAAIIRASMTLSNLGLAETKDEDRVAVELTEKGEKAVKYGLPERQILENIKEGKELEKIDIPDKNIAVGFAKKYGLVAIKKDGLKNIVIPTDAGREYLKTRSNIEEYLDLARHGTMPGKKQTEELKSRGLATTKFKIVRTIKATKEGLKVAENARLVKEVSALTVDLLKGEKWKNVSFRKYNVVAPTAKIYNGRKHPLRLVMERISNVFLEMGFKEMSGPLVETSFWCMDSMFIPQDHPAREVQDTFYLPLSGKLPDKSLVEKVNRVHETGGTSGSKGYGYKWSAEMAKKILLRTHTTATTFRYFGLKGIKPPAKYFYVGRTFRNETVDATHLPEFHQVEGFVMAEGLTLGNLKGYIKDFYAKFGIEKIKFKPAYNPYTEPSMEAFAYHEGLGRWLEIINSGMFRPEALAPYDIKVPVVAWGLAVERLAMFIYNKNNIHEILGPTCDLEWLRTYKVPSKKL